MKTIDPFLEQTELCEAAPNPTPQTMELLRSLYAQGGPVDRAYRRCNIQYTDTDFLRLVDGELFVDRQRELQSLFPSHRYRSAADRTPQPVQLKGFWTSLRNTRHLQDLGIDPARVTKELQDRLSRTESPSNALEQFFADYEWIFLGNLLADRAVDTLKKSLPSDINITEALGYFPETLPTPRDMPAGILGNTLELSDSSPCVSFLKTTPSAHIPESIPADALLYAQSMLRLREYGRWLAMRDLTPLRVERGTQPRRTPTSHQSAVAPIGVSAGIAEGILSETPVPGGIWVLKTLSPDLVNRLDGVRGVIAKNGGLLSHFVIIAREMGIPVVVKYPIETLSMSTRATIDGTTGKVTLSQSR